MRLRSSSAQLLWILSRIGWLPETGKASSEVTFTYSSFTRMLLQRQQMLYTGHCVEFRLIHPLSKQVLR